MTDTPQILQTEIERLEQEVKMVHDQVMIPNWEGNHHGLSQTLYGYLMMTFAHIDRISAFESGKSNHREQTKRMTEYLDKYVYPNNHEANSVAIQIWRHKLMHTAKPRRLRNKIKGRDYYWLLQWWIHLPRDQHWKFTETDTKLILNLGLVYLIEDLSKGINIYLNELSNNKELQENFRIVQNDFDNSEFNLGV